MTNLALKALAIATQVFTAPLDAFYVMLGRTGTLPIYWVFFLLGLVYRLLVAPLIGAAISTGASDTVKEFRKRKQSNQNAQTKKE